MVNDALHDVWVGTMGNLRAARHLAQHKARTREACHTHTHPQPQRHRVPESGAELMK